MGVVRFGVSIKGFVQESAEEFSGSTHAGLWGIGGFGSSSTQVRVTGLVGGIEILGAGAN